MVRYGYKPVMLVLIVLLAWLGTLPLASAQSAARPDVAPCHQSAPLPKSPQSQHTDHSCCAIGHGPILPTSTMDGVSLEEGDATPTTDTTPSLAMGDRVEILTVDASPSLRSNLPIRI